MSHFHLGKTKCSVNLLKGVAGGGQLVLDGLTVRQTAGTLHRLQLLHRLDELGGVPGVAGHRLAVVEPREEPGQTVEHVGDSLYETLQHAVVVAVGREQVQLSLGREGTTSLCCWNCLDFLISTGMENIKLRLLDR